MLYHLSGFFINYHPIFNVSRYITFRAIVALLCALLISFLLSPWFIKKLQKKQMKQVIRNDGPSSHFSKSGTPTMGGGLILAAVLVPALLWIDWFNMYLWYGVIVFAGFGCLGFLDDYFKVSKKNTKGLSGKWKLLVQCLISGVVCVHHYYQTDGLYAFVNMPFLKHVSVDLGVLFIPFAMFVIVGASNAVNLTDGLDGLAIGPVMMVSFCYAIFTYVSGNSVIAEYLNFPFVKGVGELSIFAACLIGAGMGFLWYNTYPAQVFMGDIGSLPLGGLLGAIAVFSKHELLLVIVGGVFVLEALSVIAQVTSFKLTGKRVLKMAPIHHHFELKGWPEPKVIVRFWIISAVLALIGILSLKIR